MNNRKGIGYIFTCFLIIILCMFIWLGMYFASIVGMIRTQRDTTKQVTDSYVTVQSIAIYDSVKNASNYGDDLTGDPETDIIARLGEYYTLVREGTDYVCYFDNSSSVRFYISDFTVAYPTDATNGSALEMTCTYTLNVPWYFLGQKVMTVPISVTVNSIFTSKL